MAEENQDIIKPLTMPSDNNNHTDGGHSNPSHVRSISALSAGSHLSLDQEAANAMELAKRRLKLNHQGQSQNTGNGKLTLDGLLSSRENGYENEATSHILKGLEKSQRNLFSNNNNNNKEVAFDPSVVFNGVTQDESDSILLDHSTPSSAVGSHRRTPSTSNNSTSERERRPLLRNPASHRRNLSVDDQLAGLSADLFALDYHHHGTTAPSVEEQAAHEDDNNNNAHLVFLKNANRVLGQFSKSHRRLFPNAADAPHLAPVNESPESVTGVSASGQETSSELDEENPAIPTTSSTSDRQEEEKPRASRHKLRQAIGGTADRLKDDMDAWGSIFNPTSKQSVLRYITKACLYLVLPLNAVAVLLFYGLGNPIPSSDDDTPTASVSWWLLFVARQVVTFSLALTLQRVMIDFLCVGTRVIPRILGPIFTLLIVQSKGWPFVLFCWSVLDFGLLYGTHPFAAHWGYWQDLVGLFNEENPSGGVVSNPWNRTVLLIGVTLPIFVALKRFSVGLFLGRQAYMHYGEPLAKVMGKMLLVSEVAGLAKRAKSATAETTRNTTADASKIAQQTRSIALALHESESADPDVSVSARTEDNSENIDFARLHDSQRLKMMELLDRWEEPERLSEVQHNATIAAVLKFRNALTLIRNRFPFSYAFGLASTREECVESSQTVYESLLKMSRDGNPNNETVTFETIALVALQHDGTIDEPKAKDLVRVFRPNRDGSLSLVDFVKSVDAVYKEFRLLQASIANSSQIDQAFAGLVNFVFYGVVVVVIMAALGLDPLALFLSLSSIILAFAFMIGSASSKYFEGLLFILVRRPYNIGDLINVNGIDEMTGFFGSIGWCVQKVTLYETTMTWLPTQETCTVANGALASSRIVNWAKSPHARFVIFLYFPIETTYETIDLFRHAVEEYMKARPREWLALNALRVLAIQTDKGFIHLELVVQHREAWQNPGAIYDSRGNLVSYCHEVQKLLGMQYVAPPLPIEFRAGSAVPAALKDAVGGPSEPAATGSGDSANITETNATSLNDKFRHAANTKHKMFF